jgi:adenosylcobinamide-phosphate synthase
MDNMDGSLILIFAFSLDLAIGDPRWLPHPVRMIGSAVAFLERRLRAIFGKGRERASGVFLIILVVLPAAALAFLVQRLLLLPGETWPAVVSFAFLVYLVATTIALRELVSSAGLVMRSVKKGDLVSARSSLSMIVGRDTQTLDEEGVLRAAIETVAENLSDGVIAPVFYFAIGGFPLAVAYKAVNTLDSMVGYKNEKYVIFGWAAARLDDAANFIPARITGILVVFASFLYFLVRRPGIAITAARNSFGVMIRDGRKHTSPNSGIPEAAMAGALGVTLGGPSTYAGVLVRKPFIGETLTKDYRAAAEQSLHVVLVAAVLGILSAVLLMR